MGKCACQREDYGTLLSFVRAPWHFAGQHLTQMSSRPSFGFGVRNPRQRFASSTLALCVVTDGSDPQAMDTPREDNPIPLQRSKTEQDTVLCHSVLRLDCCKKGVSARTTGFGHILGAVFPRGLTTLWQDLAQRVPCKKREAEAAGLSDGCDGVADVIAKSSTIV